MRKLTERRKKGREERKGSKEGKKGREERKKGREGRTEGKKDRKSLLFSVFSFGESVKIKISIPLTLISIEPLRTCSNDKLTTLSVNFQQLQCNP